MAEFSIIEEFCRGIGPDQPETILSVGDDAAIVTVPNGMELTVSVDTMVSGVHFFADVSPAKLAHKILAVNLSDMAAMGAEPKWATMALCIPSTNYHWLKSFSHSLKSVADRFQVQIIGGDTTQGPLTLSITIMGLLPQSKALYRSGAEVGDDVYVSHYLGDAALGLAIIQGKASLEEGHRTTSIAALEMPEPRVSLGQALLEVASSCVDVSDGFVGDLAHICEQSGVSIEIDASVIPLSAAYKAFLAAGGSLDFALNGGDDYELAFTAKPALRDKIARIALDLGVRLTKVGVVLPSEDLAVRVICDGVNYLLPNSYQHFS